jgi:ATP-dependent Lon protease
VARRKAELEDAFQSVRVTVENLKDFLRQPKIFNETALKKDVIGTVTGLAWTAVGGDILFIEAIKTMADVHKRRGLWRPPVAKS